MVRTPETARTLDQVCSGTKDKPAAVKVSEGGLGDTTLLGRQAGPHLLGPSLPHSESAWASGSAPP